MTEIRFFTKLLHSLVVDNTEEQCKLVNDNLQGFKQHFYRSVFSRLAGFDHLKTLRESLIFFMKHFLQCDPSDDQQKRLNTRINLAIASLRTAHN